MNLFHRIIGLFRRRIRPDDADFILRCQQFGGKWS